MAGALTGPAPGPDADARSGPTEPVEQLYRLMLSLFGTGEQFRRWVGLGMYGDELVAELPDGSSSAATVVFSGIGVLHRGGHLNAGFFGRLAAEFPLRAADIARVATIWERPASTIEAYRSPGAPFLRTLVRILVVAAVLAISLATILWAVDGPFTASMVAVERSGDMGVEPRDASVPAQAQEPVADGPPWESTDVDQRAPTGDTRVSTTGNSAGRVTVRNVAPTRQPTKKTPDAKLPQPADEAAVPSPVPPRPAVVCDLLRSLNAELSVVAQASLSSPAVHERFTVILREHANAAEVSPRPPPGQTSRLQLYERLLKLGSAELAGCRDIPIDITFSRSRTTITPRVP